jgi:predicted GNAT superfamily acetyltransferase
VCEALADQALADLCRLNNDHVVETSYLSEQELARLISIAVAAPQHFSSLSIKALPM